MGFSWEKQGMQLTLEQHRFELHRSTYMQIFSIKYIGKFLEICNNLKNSQINCVPEKYRKY